MINLKIKTGVLLFVIVFEIIAYSTLQLFNHYTYKEELLKLKHQEIEQTFIASNGKIDNLSLLMERNVTDLAIAGEQLFNLKQNALLSLTELEQKAQELLIANFRSFPEAIGGGIWYEPGIIEPSIIYFGPYAYNDGNIVKFSWDLNTPKYDYHSQDWYTIASSQNWGIDQIRTHPIFWTEPYVDDAGSFSLMMTVDAVMLSPEGEPIGMATVDWSLLELTNFLYTIRITENSTPFFVHRASKQFLGHATNPQLITKEVTTLDWGVDLLKHTETNQLFVLQDILIKGQPHNIYYSITQSGFIFGSISPLSDMASDIDKITNMTLLVGAGIGSTFILVIIVLMHMAFKPFDRVLELIKSSISHPKEDNESIAVSNIEYDKNNEFTPIIKELNGVYQQVNHYMQQIVETNVELNVSKVEINSLNSELEQKVELRTKQLEAKTQEALDSLNQLEDTQRQLVEQEKNASLGRLVTGIAHEVNTPLGICITASSLIKEELSSMCHLVKTGKLTKNEYLESYGRFENAMDLLQTNLDRTTELIANFKQIAVDQYSDQIRQFDLKEYVNKIIATIQPKVESANNQIDLECEDNELIVNSIPGAITQIITNIVENANSHAFHQQESGSIHILLSQNESHVFISISDNGSGIDEEERKFIFDPFYTTARNQGASGLGLHIVYNVITQKLKGKIDCNSKPKLGTCFKISFPINLET